jgi:hypothetical protein
LIFIKADLVALSFRVVASVGPENAIINKLSQDQLAGFGTGGSHSFPAFAGGTTFSHGREFREEYFQATSILLPAMYSRRAVRTLSSARKIPNPASLNRALTE